MITKLFGVIVAVACLLGAGTASFGEILPLLTGPAASGLRNDGDFGGTGFRFTVGSSDLTVIAVGVWDYQDDGSAPYDIQVDLTGASTASFVVPAGPAGTFDEPDGFRYVSVTPFTLSAGQTYDLQADYTTGGGELWHDAGAVTASSFDASPLITNISETYGPGGGAGNIGGEAFGGPEFLVVVPEPASLGLLAIGGVILLRRRRA